jgi:hypothetical protein
MFINKKAEITLRLGFVPAEPFLALIGQINTQTDWVSELVSAPRHDEEGRSMYWAERISTLSPSTQLISLCVREGDLIAVEQGFGDESELVKSLILAIAGVKRTSNANYFSPYKREEAGVCEYAPKRAKFQKSSFCKFEGDRKRKSIFQRK